MKILKKLTLWFLCINLCYIPQYQAEPIKERIVWEEHIPTGSLSLIATIVVCSIICYPNNLTAQFLSKNLEAEALRNKEEAERQIAWEKQKLAEAQEQIEREKQRLAEFQKSITVYRPTINSYNEHYIQKFANQTKLPVVHIDEYTLKNNIDFMDIFFTKAKKLGQCFIYIEKKVKNTSSFLNSLYKHNRFFNHSSDDILPDTYIAKFIKQMQLLRLIDSPIFIIGIRNHQNFGQSIHDISSIGFDLEKTNPSFYERIEFLQLLLKNKNITNLDVKKIARKTISFSYFQIIELIQKTEKIAQKNNAQIINMKHLQTAYDEIIKAHEIDLKIFNNLYKTCVHEIGHAIITAYLHENFILHNVSITPQYKIEDSITYQIKSIELGRSQSTTKAHYESQRVSIQKERIMICFAGKIAEQIFFGLSNKDPLNNETGFSDFLHNPDGADEDLTKAKDSADEINKINQISKDSLLKDLYAKTLALLLSYKKQIEICAKLLEQDEFVTASQITKILEETR